ncbi:MAG: hypothetical protein MJZ68_04825 [archaeon]|nr:hypothetical protein [archaeon]
MSTNSGNKYRTSQVFMLAALLISIAAAVLIYGLTDLGVGATVGAFLLIFGAAMIVVSLTYSKTPDKFGPSESMYRMVFGAILVLVGIVAVLYSFSVDWFVYVAVFLIGIALIGLCAGLTNSKKSKY